MNTNTRCSGCNPTPMTPAMPPMGPYETCCQVVEPTTVCPYQQHHYHRVDHIKPVVIRNIHHHHTQHNYVTAPSQTTEAYYYDEYLATPQPVATPIMQQPFLQQNQTQVVQQTIAPTQVVQQSFVPYPTQTTGTMSAGQETVTSQNFPLM